MTQDPSHFLNELPIWKLKIIAKQFNIDTSECRYKRDYVNTIKSKNLSESQVRAALADAKKEDAGAESDTEVTAIGRELEEIAAKPPEPAELPENEQKTVERHVDEALTMKPTFFEVDSTTEHALNRMIVGDYSQAIKINREARMKCLSNFSAFQVYSAAVSIRAAEELLSKMPADRGIVDPNLRTALAAAKRAFINGTPRQREETLENLEELASKAYAAFISGTEKEEAELRELLADYESFGTRTEEPRRYLEIASGAKGAFDIAQYSTILAEARKQAEAAKDVRVKEIENAFNLVRASAAEAKDAGAEVPSADVDLAEARRAYNDGSFRKAVELLASIERATDSAHLQQMKIRKELETRHLERARAALITFEPILREAAGHGIDIQEPTSLTLMIRGALSAKDAVAAAKLSRRLSELVQATEMDMDRKKAEAGLIKQIPGAKCGKCGRKSLYEHPNNIQKCLECGHTFSVAIESGPPAQAAPAPRPAAPAEAPQAEKKKRGFLKW